MLVEPYKGFVVRVSVVGCEVRDNVWLQSILHAPVVQCCTWVCISHSK